MLEYLILNNKFEAAKRWEKTDTKSISDKLMQYFNQGNREEFMDYFSLLRKQSKLEFYLMVYFMIYSIHPATKVSEAIPQKQRAAFKHYLNNKGAELAKESQFLQFFSLPFVKKPLENQNFKNLFKKQWVRILKEKLIHFLADEEKRVKTQCSKLLSGSMSAPCSSSPSEADAKVYTEKIKQMQKINKKLFQQIKDFTSKYQNLQDDHKAMAEGFNSHMLQSQSKWFQITKQLVNCSKSLIHMLISSESTFLTDRKFIKIKKRTQKYEKFVNKKFDDLISQSQDISIFDKPSINQLSYSMAPYTQKNLTAMIGVEEYLPTDYTKMKSYFKRASPQEKIGILNGLYWRVVRSKDKHVRRLNLVGIFKEDFLGLYSGDLDELLASRQLMKPTVRLLQMISLDTYGKKIIFVNNHLHRDFVGLIFQCEDENCLEYIMHTLGQISSSKKFKPDLINLGIIEICMELLRKGEIKKNEIILQNISAILLNMLEKDQAYPKFQKQYDLFYILMQYTQIPFKVTNALMYGIIYALLENQELFQRAHDQNLTQHLHNVLKSDPTVNKKQLKILLEKLDTFQAKEINYSGDSDDDDEDSNQEEDFFDVDEEIPDIEELMKCHEDIVSRFGLKGNEGRKQCREVKQAFQELKSNKIPSFSQPKKQKEILPKIISSPKHTAITKNAPETPYIQQHPILQNFEQKPVARRKDNFISSQEKRSNNFRIKEKEAQRPITRQREERENNQQMRKSKSAEKTHLSKEKVNRQIYESNRLPAANLNRVAEFHMTDEKNYRSPQVKKPREEVLKQLNDQIKAESKKQKERKRVSTAEPRQNQFSSFLRSQVEEKKQVGEAFESRPKLRRTPPHDDDD